MKKTMKLIKKANHLSPVSTIEPLERRDYFDLVPSITGVLPTQLVASVKNNSSITIDLANTGDSTAKGSYTLTLYASTSRVLGDAADTQIAAITKSAAVPAGKSTPVKFKLTDFPDVANGSYYLLVEVIGALAGVGDNVAASASTIAVTDPFVDLSDSVSIASPNHDQVLPGKPVTLSLEVFNSGNVPAKGPLITDLGLVAVGSETITPIATPTSHINIAPGGHQIIRVSEKIPLGVTPGTYNWTATVDPGNTFDESNTANNSANSSVLTVLDPYPDLLGTFIGPDKIEHGPAKGVTVRIALDFTSENQANGAVVAAGTLYASTTSTFNFSGSITAKDVFTGHGSSTNSIFTATYKGKLVGSTLTGSVVNTDGNSGVFTLQRSL